MELRISFRKYLETRDLTITLTKVVNESSNELLVEIEAGGFQFEYKLNSSEITFELNTGEQLKNYVDYIEQQRAPHFWYKFTQGILRRLEILKQEIEDKIEYSKNVEWVLANPETHILNNINNKESILKIFQYSVILAKIV